MAVMGPSEAVLQVFPGTVTRHFRTPSCFIKSDSIPSYKYQMKCTRKRVSRYMKVMGSSSMPQIRIGTRRFQGIGSSSPGSMGVRRSWLQSCKCQQSESGSGITTENVNGSWFVDGMKNFDPMNGAGNGPNVLEFQDVQLPKQENEGLTSNSSNGNGSVRVKDDFHKISVDPIVDEAWDLLRESVVHYCGSPIGTIAANDPTSSNVLNYDQVFIRDFIPSGIAFLLKGEYDIVRNFILHTLQLQVVT